MPPTDARRGRRNDGARKRGSKRPNRPSIFRLKVSPPFLAWMLSFAVSERNDAAAAVLGRFGGWIMIYNAAEAVALGEVFEYLGDQTSYVGHRGASFRGFAVRRIDRLMERALSAHPAVPIQGDGQ